MKLVASMMVGPGEADRYLGPCLDVLGGFCDEIRVLLDGTDADTLDLVCSDPLVQPKQNEEPMFEHEGRARQRLWEWTLQAEPTHVLSVDADELVTDGQAIRAACEGDEGNGAWTLPIEEVWKADERFLWTRQDGGWRTHPVPVLFRAPDRVGPLWRIQDRQLACGREPMAVRPLANRAPASGSSLLHFGWANQAERQARYDRYAAADGGRFHASSHLRSILAPDRRVKLQRREWPAALGPYRAGLLERANRVPVA